MSRFSWKNNRRECVYIALIALFFLGMVLLEVIPVTYSEQPKVQQLLSEAVPLLFGSVGTFLFLCMGRSKLFFCPQKAYYLVPALLIAVNNFPFYTYFSGQGVLYPWSGGVWVAFALSCVAVGLYEELLFRGVLFPLFARAFAPNKRGLVLSIVFSSIIFGAVHLVNLFAGAGIIDTLLQVVYSTLMGGLCAFVLVQTHQIFFCVAVHTLFNFCGLLLPTLGAGTWMIWQTALVMFIPALLVGTFVLYRLIKYREWERVRFYQKLGFAPREK